MRKGLKGLVLALALAGCSEAVADTIVSNLNNPPYGVDTNGQSQGADSFIPATTEYLQSVTLELENVTGSSILVSIYSNNSATNTPQTDLLTLGTIVPSGAPSTYSTYTLNAPPATLQLSANTIYWVVGTYVGAPDWAYTAYPGNYTGSGSFYSFANYYNSGPEAGWNTMPLTNGPYMVQVNGVPEPGSMILAAIGLTFGIGTCGLRHRRAMARPIT